jgi:uncharacterized protein YjlB
MVQVKRYNLPPTPLIPNSPNPLLHYPCLLTSECEASPNAAAVKCHELFAANGWQTQWVNRYGPTQQSHYHSRAHEAMVVLTGTARIRFGVADTADDLEESTHSAGKEQGGVEVDARAGDVFVLPAGVAHKTYDATPRTPYQLLTPGDGHGFGDQADITGTLDKLDLKGFTMIGAYPADGSQWDFAVGGDDVGKYEKVWEVGKPKLDPVLGDATEGTSGLWK